MRENGLYLGQAETSQRPGNARLGYLQQSRISKQTSVQLHPLRSNLKHHIICTGPVGRVRDPKLSLF